MKYTQFEYLFPPRPDNAIVSSMLGYFEKRGWLAQYKKNGTNTIIAIAPNKEFIAMNRHADFHKAWQLTDHIKNELAKIFKEKKWFVLCAEIMHSKGPTIKDTIYVHDMLVWKSEFLLESTFLERQVMLDERLVTNVEAQSHYVCDSEGKIWYAKRFDKDFKTLFSSIKNPKIDEGLVLKDPDGKLRSCRTASDNSYWQVKCRHKAKGYQF
jgi:ATP-dependent DNA ligase